MGYCYDGRGRLCCDCCGNAGGVRKRRCPATVERPEGRLPYCPATAMCDACRREYPADRWRKVHAACFEGAAKSMERNRKERARMQEGAARLTCGYGDHDPLVPAGMVGAIFTCQDGTEIGFLIPASDYRIMLDDGSACMDWDFPTRKPWHEYTKRPASKRVG